MSDKTLLIGFNVTGQASARYCERNNIPYAIYDRELDNKPITQFSPTKCFNDTSINDCALTEFNRLIVSPGISLQLKIIQRAQQENIEITNDVDLFAKQVKGKLIAITGSNGKSTVTKWLTHVLQENQVIASACGNIGNPLLDALYQSEQEQTNHSEHYWVMELSSFQIEKVKHLQVDIACVLNISADHLDYHKDFTDYQQIKQHLLTLAKQHLINLDDFDSYPPIFLKNNALRISLNPPKNLTADYYVANKQLMSPLGSVVAVNELYLAVPHNISNALFVCAFAHWVGLTSQQVKQTISTWQGLRHRFQILKNTKSSIWVNDSKGTNVGAVKAALQSCIKLKYVPANTKNIHLILGGICKDSDFSELSELVQNTVKILYLFGQDRGLIAEQLYPYLDNVMGKLFNSLDEVIQNCRLFVDSEDIVLFSPGCASFDQFDNYQQRGEYFMQLAHNVS